MKKKVTNNKLELIKTKVSFSLIKRKKAINKVKNIILINKEMTVRSMFPPKCIKLVFSNDEVF